MAIARDHRAGQEVVLISSNKEMRELTAAALKLGGYNSILLDDPDSLAKDYLSLLMRHALDLVTVIDCDGLDHTAYKLFFQELEKLELLPSVVLLSPFSDDRVIRFANRLGVATILEKPFEIDQLLKVIEVLTNQNNSPESLATAIIGKTAVQSTSWATSYPLYLHYIGERDINTVQYLVSSTAQAFLTQDHHITQVNIEIDESRLGDTDWEKQFARNPEVKMAIVIIVLKTFFIE